MVTRVYVDVDTQHDFCSPDGALFVRGAPATMGPIAALLGAARRDGSPIVGSVDSHSHDAWEFATNDRRGPGGEKPNFPPHCVKGTAGWLKLTETLPSRFYFVPMAPDVDAAGRIPAGTEAVYFEKEVYSLFANPNAEAVLDAFCPPGPVEFVVFGVATDYCVAAAARGLVGWVAARSARAGSRVRLAVDAVAAVAPAQGERTLRALAEEGVALDTTASILAPTG